MLDRARQGLTIRKLEKAVAVSGVLPGVPEEKTPGKSQEETQGK